MRLSRSLAVAALLIAVLMTPALALRTLFAQGNERVALPLPPGAQALNMELVGTLPLDGVQADIWAHGSFVYVGTAGAECQGTGVKAIDISNPASPTLVGVVAAHPDSAQEDFAAVAVNTPTFRGDLMAVGLQPCGRQGLEGVEFWDVTNPGQAERLGFLGTPNVNGVHELALVQRPSDGRVLVLATVPFSEVSGQGGDVRIIDATDPRNPVQVGHWGTGLGLLDGQGQWPVVICHSVAVDPAGLRAFPSCWDAGFYILDIADPANPVLVGKTTYATDDEGSGHSTALAQSGRILVGADEDFVVEVKGTRINAPAAMAGMIESLEPASAGVLAQTGPVTGDLVYVGRACPPGERPDGVPGGDPLLADPAGRIALLDGDDQCDFTPQVKRMADARAIGAVVISQRPGHPYPWSPFIPSDIPAVMIRAEDGERIKATLAEGTPVNVTLSDDITLGFNPWGQLHFYDIASPGNPVEIGRFGIAASLTDPVRGPTDSGIHSAHNPVVDGNLLFASWYSDGVRVLDIGDPANPREVGYFVPPPTPKRTDGYPDGPLVWGVVKLGDLVLLSDVHYGLWILRYTPT